MFPLYQHWWEFLSWVDVEFCQMAFLLLLRWSCDFFFKLIYLFLAALGLRFCVRAFSSCGERGPLFIVVRGPLTIAASLVAEHKLQTRRLSNCGSRAQLLRGMWDPPRPGLEPMSPALAGGLSTTAPPGKPDHVIFILPFINVVYHIDWFGIMNHLFIPGINPTWSWCMILFLCCWIWFVDILLRIFACILIRGAGL